MWLCKYDSPEESVASSRAETWKCIAAPVKLWDAVCQWCWHSEHAVSWPSVIVVTHVFIARVTCCC